MEGVTTGSQAGMAAAEGPLPAAAQRPAPAPKAVTITPFPAPATLSDGAWLYFSETGHYVSGGFKAYFEANGGLAVFGYPITEELVEDGWTVQYFQRARLEFHPGAPAPVQRALLADMLLDLIPGARAGAQFRTAGAGPAAGRHFPETGFGVSGPFLEFFDRAGGVAALGYPISEAAGGVQWFQRGRLELIGGTVQAALIGDEYTELAGLAHARARAQPPQVGRVSLARNQDTATVYAAPAGGDVVTSLAQDAQVRVTGEERGPDGEIWYAVRLWNAVDGYVRRGALAFTPAPPKPPGAAAAPWRPPPAPAQGPFPLEARGSIRTTTDAAGMVDGPPAGRAPAGAGIRASAWATDARGRVWYQVHGEGVSGWVPAQAVRLVPPAPSADRAAAASPQIVAGKGMWFTYEILRTTPPELIVATARANGLSFLAPQVGTSRRGYWAGKELDALLPLAHAAGLKVIPWIYPWLADIPADLELAVTAARHVAPTGDAVDALAVDLEENLDEGAILAYSQLLRHAVGPDRLLIAITFQPQIASGRRTPFGVLAEWFDVIAPMSYWHTRPVRYSYQDAYQYVAESIRLIRERSRRPDVPIAVLGQTFDWFSRNEVGPGNPTAEETRGAMQAARDHGALGIGFFNWYSATPEEWEAIGSFPW